MPKFDDMDKVMDSNLQDSDQSENGRVDDFKKMKKTIMFERPTFKKLQLWCVQNDVSHSDAMIRAFLYVLDNNPDVMLPPPA